VTMNLFGAIVNVESIHRQDLLDEILVRASKRSDERKLLRDFLLNKSVGGGIRFDELREKIMATPIEVEVDGNIKNAVVDYCRSQLEKVKTSSGVSLYRGLVLQVVEKEGDLRCKKAASEMRKGAIFSSESLPASFPVVFNKAENILMGKLRSDVGNEEYEGYFRSKNLNSEISTLTRDLFYGINNSLDREQLFAFVGARYEMRKLQMSIPTNETTLKQNLLEAIKSEEPLNLVHIKCLRFTYPFGNRLQLVDHVRNVEVPTKDGGVHRPVSEVQLFDRLADIRRIFEELGIKVRLKVLLSDQDLIDYFPRGGDGVVPDADLLETQESLFRYKLAISQQMDGSEVEFLREFMSKNGVLNKFDSLRRNQLDQLRSGRSPLSEGLVESRVDYRYESNKKILDTDPGREFARERVYAQLASLLSLGVLGRNGVVLIEEDKGEENKIIGGVGKSSLPVFFTKLRDAL